MLLRCVSLIQIIRTTAKSATTCRIINLIIPFSRSPFAYLSCHIASKAQIHVFLTDCSCYKRRKTVKWETIKSDRQWSNNKTSRGKQMKETFSATSSNWQINNRTTCWVFSLEGSFLSPANQNQRPCSTLVFDLPKTTAHSNPTRSHSVVQRHEHYPIQESAEEKAQTRTMSDVGK